ncbi:uncharacterized protein Z520_11564 [Fonsecaea multimorphosa CBS 102226]|uniref:Uncharacterized protein n=1 Tax=Fonsecaea multimorphosa CBS 102226 TaxID=1442371 RepID=A0A0D2JHN1_9EURO|nr:uncharacterized protein Z520_11564 [Fonsecaea multimorphosa CBS 102226]KIX92712.1 hypothetical protein Z520_11564 [Fonsecaea multimorphosa CBS 102226]OAL17954.1 hypothetical protein AYO22_11110 [Fonsecaea multimorphosa]
MPRKGVKRTLPNSPSDESQSSPPSPELGIFSNNPRLPPNFQALRAVHIALDTGTEYTKAAFLLEWVNNGLPAAAPIPVIWANGESSVLTQVAVRHNRRMLWGDEVSQELKKGHINESQVIRRLKPSLFDARALTQRPFQTDLSIAKDRKNQLIKSLESCGEDPDDYRLENISVFSEYMGFAYRGVLQNIAKMDGNLGWPVLNNLDEYKSWKPQGNVKINVSLPVPIGAKPGQVQMVVAAAKAAGIPNPYPVAEPASALIHHLHKARDHLQSIIGKTFVILDIGAGSADQQVWTVVNENPLQVRELIIPDRVRTAWCGGAYINAAAVKLIMDGIDDKDLVLRALQSSGSPITDIDSLERRLNKKFEKEKQRFEGRETLYLRIPGLPDKPAFRLDGGGNVVLEAEDVKSAFAKCLDDIISMLDTSIQSVFQSRTSGGTIEQRVQEIIVVGGCSQNRYLLEQIRNRYSIGLNSPFSYPIPVTLPPDAAKGSVTVAQGAVLLSAEKQLIQQRYVRRSFCVKRYEEVNQRHYPRESQYRSPQDGRIRVPITRFLLRQGLHAQQFSCDPFQGWKGLMQHEVDKDGYGLIEETLYYSDTVAEDGLWIDDDALDIHEMPAPLRIRLTLDEVRRFQRRKGTNNRWWYHVDYELILTLDGHIMTFKFIIPRTGRWPTRGDRYADVMYRTGQYDTVGVSQLFNSAEN